MSRRNELQGELANMPVVLPQGVMVGVRGQQGRLLGRLAPVELHIVRHEPLVPVEGRHAQQRLPLRAQGGCVGCIRGRHLGLGLQRTQTACMQRVG